MENNDTTNGGVVNVIRPTMDDNVVERIDALEHEGIPIITLSGGSGWTIRLPVNLSKTVEIRLSDLQMMLLYRNLKRSLDL